VNLGGTCLPRRKVEPPLFTSEVALLGMQFDWGSFSGERLELFGGVGGIDVVGTKEHQLAGGKTATERSKTQLVIVVILTIDDDAVDVDAGVEYCQLTSGRQLPQTYTAVRRTGRHELVAR